MKAHGVADNAALDALLVGERHAEEVAVNGDARSPAVLRRPALSEVIAFLREGGKAKRESGTDRTARARAKSTRRTDEHPHLDSPSMVTTPREPLAEAKQSSSSTMTVLTTVDGHSLRDETKGRGG